MHKKFLCYFFRKNIFLTFFSLFAFSACNGPRLCNQTHQCQRVCDLTSENCIYNENQERQFLEEYCVPPSSAEETESIHERSDGGASGICISANELIPVQNGFCDRAVYINNQQSHALLKELVDEVEACRIIQGPLTVVGDGVSNLPYEGPEFQGESFGLSRLEAVEQLSVRNSIVTQVRFPRLRQTNGVEIINNPDLLHVALGTVLNQPPNRSGDIIAHTNPELESLRINGFSDTGHIRINSPGIDRPCNLQGLIGEPSSLRELEFQSLRNAGDVFIQNTRLEGIFSLQNMESAQNICIANNAFPSQPERYVFPGMHMQLGFGEVESIQLLNNENFFGLFLNVNQGHSISLANNTGMNQIYIQNDNIEGLDERGLLEGSMSILQNEFAFFREEVGNNDYVPTIYVSSLEQPAESLVINENPGLEDIYVQNFSRLHGLEINTNPDLFELRISSFSTNQQILEAGLTVQDNPALSKLFVHHVNQIGARQAVENGNNLRITGNTSLATIPSFDDVDRVVDGTFFSDLVKVYGEISFSENEDEAFCQQQYEDVLPSPFPMLASIFGNDPVRIQDGNPAGPPVFMDFGCPE